MKVRDVQEAIAWLKCHGTDVGKQMQAGRVSAKRVAEAYTLLYHATGDPGAQALLVVRLNEYLAEEKQ